MNIIIGLVLLGPMVISQGNSHVGSFHVPQVVLQKNLGERFCERIGTLGVASEPIIGVTTLGSNGDKLLPLPQPPVRARTDARTNPSAQRATQLRRVLARV
jgi:hypothetical protein